MDKRYLSNTECQDAAVRMYHSCPAVRKENRVYGIPRGGIPVAYLLMGTLPGNNMSVLVDDPAHATLFVDDIVDSGRTRAEFASRFPNVPFLALTDHLAEKPAAGQWVVFPWERGKEDTSADDIVVRLLQYIGENPDREGLKETPQRVLRAWKEWTAGYSMDPDSLFKCFTDGGEKYDEMIVVRDLPFYSHCEHHLAPFFGTVSIAYIPNNGRIVGLSKLGRLVSVFSKRLQVQERLTVQIADKLNDALSPRGVGVLVKATHLCMRSRGISSHGDETLTSALRGVFLSDEKVRNEFLSMTQ